MSKHATFPKPRHGKRVKACRRCGKIVEKRGYRKYCGRACFGLSRTSKPKAPCPICGKLVPTLHSKTCSAKCAGRLRSLAVRPPKVCSVCGKEYFSQGRIKLKYCSLRCYNVVRAKEGFFSFACAQCGNMCRRRKVRTRPRRHYFCGPLCAQRFNTGPNNYAWRGGSDPNRGAKWLKLARAIRDRDGHVCQRCGTTEAENCRRLDVDHIRPWRSFATEAEANRPENLVSLCKRCHRSKTSGAELAWLRGDRIAMMQYERSVKLPPLFAAISS